MKLTLNELAGLVGGTLKGDPANAVTGAASLVEAGPEDVAFLADLKHEGELAGCKACCVLVPADFKGTFAGAQIAVGHPQIAFAKVLALLDKERQHPPKGIHLTAVIHPTAVLASGVSIGAHCVIEEGARIGEGTVLYPQVYVGAQTLIGRDCLIYPHVTIRERCELGDRVILHPGTVIGADGYGYAQEGGLHHKIPQVGRAVIENDVEVGANVCIDRATLGETRIGAGTKIDNLVQIAHNVKMGKGCLIVGQAGIAGSSTLGDYVILAGQVAIKDHLSIGSKAVVMGQSGVTSDVPEGGVVFGTLARPFREAMKIQALLGKLSDLFDDVKALKKAAGGR